MGFLELIVGPLLGGGATGLLGMIAQRYFDHKNAQLQRDRDKDRYAHEALMRDKDAAIMREEYAGRLKVAQTEGETAKDVADTQAFSQSLFKEPERYSYAATLSTGQQWLMVLLDCLRGSIRPLLTLYLCMLTTYIWWQVRQLVQYEELGPEEVLAVWKLVVQTILYLWTTVTLWWFGTRNKQPVPSAQLPFKS